MGPIFPSIAILQEKCIFVCKNRRIGEAETKVNIFIYKIFTINLHSHNQSTQPLQCGAGTCKVKPLQGEVIFSLSSTLSYSYLVIYILVFIGQF